MLVSLAENIELTSTSFKPLKATEEKSLSVTLKMQGCVDGLTGPSTQQRTAGRDVREGTRCPTVGRPLTTPPGQLQV